MHGTPTTLGNRSFAKLASLFLTRTGRCTSARPLPEEVFVNASLTCTSTVTRENSTLRKTLAGVLKAAGCPPPDDDVSNYMHAHLSVALLPVDDEVLIPRIERKPDRGVGTSTLC